MLQGTSTVPEPSVENARMGPSRAGERHARSVACAVRSTPKTVRSAALCARIAKATARRIAVRPAATRRARSGRWIRVIRDRAYGPRAYVGNINVLPIEAEL